MTGAYNRDMRNDLPCLTGLRGILAVIVVLFHCRLPGLGFGWLAVDGFFALSGYVLAHVYCDGFGRGSFLWARFARIAPAQVVITGIWGGMPAADEQHMAGDITVTTIPGPGTIRSAECFK